MNRRADRWLLIEATLVNLAIANIPLEHALTIVLDYKSSVSIDEIPPGNFIAIGSDLAEEPFSKQPIQRQLRSIKHEGPAPTGRTKIWIRMTETGPTVSSGN